MSSMFPTRAIHFKARIPAIEGGIDMGGALNEGKRDTVALSDIINLVHGVVKGLGCGRDLSCSFLNP
jgi:hypothetical protein